MSMGAAHFREAARHVRGAIQQIDDLRFDYQRSDLPSDIKAARVAALTAKIDAFRAVVLDGDAHPWAWDGAS
jgi:hypothetical protein